MSTFKGNKKAKATNDWDASMAATKAAQVAAIRQRCSDVAVGIIDEIPSDYIGGWHPKKLVRYGYAIEAMLELPTGIVVEQQFTSIDSLAAWLWERGVRG